MQQKIQFIAAVMHNPDLIILDEPFSGLDPINVELLKEIVLELKAEGKTIIFSTHQMEVAEKLCDDIWPKVFIYGMLGRCCGSIVRR